MTSENNMANPLVYLMKNYAAYNSWANITLVNWLKTKPEELLKKEVLSSFPSIELTLAHIWRAQVYWLSVIKKEEAAFPEAFKGELQDLLELLIIQSEELAAYIDEMTDETLQEHNLVVNPWFHCNFANFEYIQQIVNHSTYHRGQLITIGRNLGFTDAPITDYNFYNVVDKKQENIEI